MGGPDARGHGHRHAELHGARAAHGRRRARAADRPLVARRVHLRGDDRAPPVRGRRPRRHRAQGLRGPLPVPSKVNPRSPPGSTRGSRARARATRRALPVRRTSSRRRSRACAASAASAWRRSTRTRCSTSCGRTRCPAHGRSPAATLSPRTALLAGLVLGIAMMVGVLGFLAWRERATPATNAAPAPSTLP